MPEHASSMARPTADDHLTVDGDANVVVGAELRHAAGTLHHAAHRRIVDRRTQYHPLSAAIDNRRSAERHAGPSSIVLPGVAVGEQDSAADG